MEMKEIEWGKEEKKKEIESRFRGELEIIVSSYILFSILNDNVIF